MAKRAWTTVICRQCGKQFEARNSHLKRGQMKYCSAACGGKASRRHAVAEFDGERYYYNRATGYYANPSTRKILHRAIWELHHGPIPAGHVVHHIDGDRLNNVLENLQLLSWGAHSSHHGHQRLGKVPSKRKPCSESGCDRISQARGLCTMHYQRARAKEIGWPGSTRYVAWFRENPSSRKPQ